MAQAPQEYALRINGNPIVTTRPAVRVAGEWFVPLAPVARALGSDLKLDPTAQSFRIVRGDGVTASYDAASGRILQGAVLAAQVANFRQIQLNVGVDNILFPLDGVIALFGVTVREDFDRQILEIESLPSTGASGSAGKAPGFQLASLESRYVMSTNGQVWQQTDVLKGQGLFGSNRITGNLELGGGAGGSFVAFRQGFVRLETAGRRVITAGDQGTYYGMEALGNAVRGMGYEFRWRKFTADVYGGLAASSVSSALGSSGVASYDTPISGFGLRYKSKTMDFSLAGNAFHGSLRSGTAFGASFGGTYKKNEFKLQGLTGYFSGFSMQAVVQPPVSTATDPAATVSAAAVPVTQDAGQVKGPGYGYSIVDSFSPFSHNKLSFSGLLEHYSRNVLVVKDDSRFSAVSRKSLSASLRPFRYIGFTGSIHENASLLINTDVDRGYTYGVNGSTPGPITVQPGYFKSVQTFGGPLGRFVLSQYSLQLPNFNRYSASATYSETQLAGVSVRTVREIFTADFKRYGRMGFHDQTQLATGRSYGVDWSRQFSKGAYFMGGLERQTGLRQRPTFAPVISLRVPLPRSQSLTVSYLSVRGSSLFRFELGGPMLRQKEIITMGNAQTVLVVPSSVSGRVYRDVSLNGQFKSGVDRPLQELKVWLDEVQSTTTDADGYYRFDGIVTGTHRLRVDTANLPARLVLAAEDMKVAVMPYRVNRQDFRAIPGGKIQGIVTIVRLSEDGRLVVKPFPDARIIASGNRDTYSEGDGAFILADLPPGTYELHLDPTTVPAGFAPIMSLRTVELKPGQSVGGTDFRLARPVVVKQAPPPKKEE